MERIRTLLRLISELTSTSARSKVAGDLARHCGADDLVIFVLDPVVDVFIPAFGFPRTLPDAIEWQRFVSETSRRGQHEATLPYPVSGQEHRSVGFSSRPDSVLVFVGGAPDPELTACVLDILPTLRVTFQAEQSVLSANATTSLARNATQQLRAQALSLDQARRSAHEEVIERHKAEEALSRKALELERSNKDLQHFSATVSHDLQEPLRMVSSYLALIERRYAQKLDDKAREYIGHATSGAHRMSQLIRSLLDYAQVGTDDRSFVMVPLETVVIEAMDNLSQRISETGAHIHFDDLPSVHGDHVLLVQLFQNLVSNGIKFMRPGVVPEVRVTAVDDGGHWKIAVSDNGIGISVADRERIFGVFQRLHTRDAYEGCGIGLATCKRIIERHGGEVWVESAVGSGSTFFFTLAKSPA
ncbi:MAG: hypothetical protein H0W83_10640 [Planctomycetes bacterium]|nr:hypothetical protein [Planctomycetota bacterium]